VGSRKLRLAAHKALEKFSVQVDSYCCGDLQDQAIATNSVIFGEQVSALGPKPYEYLC